MSGQKKYKILMIDDDRFLLNMYETKFKKNGHDVISLTNGEEAITKLKEGLRPDVIVLDIIMPHTNGLDILKTIREGNLAPDSAVVMLTNQGDSKEIERAKELGMNGYIVKAALIPSEVATEVIRIAEEHHKS